MTTSTSEDNSLDYVVSVAAEQTIDVWKVTSAHLVRFCRAKKIEIVVPDDQTELFRRVTPEEITVTAESVYTTPFAGALREHLGPEHPRYGWYLQQFIKLEAISRNSDSERLLIWDADTVPLRELRLFDAEGTPRYYSGRENHRPYFQLIESLLGMTRSVNFSFVAQCFPLTGAWATTFFREIENAHAMPWWAAIIARIDPAEQSGFSEYETLGTFVNERFGPLSTHPTNAWSRFGYYLVDSPEALTGSVTVRTVRRFDFVAFEEWHRRRGLVSRGRRLLVFLDALWPARRPAR